MIKLRQKTFDILYDNNRYNTSYSILKSVIIALIFLDVLALCSHSSESLGNIFGMKFLFWDLFVKFIFLIEHILRVWTCVENRNVRFRKPFIGRMRYMTTPSAIIDLLSVIPWIALTMDENMALLLELVVILKIVKYSPALTTLGKVLYAERKPILASLFIMFIILVFSSGVMWVLEKDFQPNVFSSIPASMWWSIATLTTVGYGDVTPLTPLGKAFGGLIAVSGIAMFTLPAGLLAAGFAKEIKRKDFMTNFSMVSKVPFFKGLEPKRLAEITSILQPREVPPRFLILKKGEVANTIYFITKGEVEMDLSHGVVSLGEGEFFGEVSALGGGGIRTASVTSLTETTLLMLKNEDLKKMLEGWPEIKDKLQQAMINKSYNQKKLYESWLENIS